LGEDEKKSMIETIENILKELEKLKTDVARLEEMIKEGD